MVTIREVASTAGVSTQTVSRTISGKGYVAAETRARVRETIRSLGYTPNRVASSMATGRTRSIAQMLIERIGGDASRGEVIFPHQLIVRESAPAPTRIERAPVT